MGGRDPTKIQDLDRKSEIREHPQRMSKSTTNLRKKEYSHHHSYGLPSLWMARVQARRLPVNGKARRILKCGEWEADKPPPKKVDDGEAR